MAGGNSIGELAGTGVVDGSADVGITAGDSAEGVSGAVGGAVISGNAMSGVAGTGVDMEGLAFKIGADARLDLYQV